MSETRAAADYVGLTDEIKAKFKSDLADEAKNPTADVSQWLHRLNQWAAGTYPKGLTYDDLRWMAQACVDELHKRDPKSEASMDGFPSASEGKEADGPAEKKAAGEDRCQAGQAALAAAGESRSAVHRRPKKRRHRAGPPLGREFRRFASHGLEVRSADSGDGIVITGTPIVYNQAYWVTDMLGEFEETMHPGVATNVLAGQPDVRFLINHDGMPLARTASGTLTLEDRADGLCMSATLDARQQLANDLAVAIERGDVSQMSCGFVVANDQWNDDYTCRDIFRFAELFDVSAVTYPASPTTSIDVAHRMWQATPVESRARVRRLWAITRELREGKMLSAENADLLATALESLHEADDALPSIAECLQTVDHALDAGQAALAEVLGRANPDDDDADEETDGQDGSSTGSDGSAPPGIQDGTGSRSVPATAAERRTVMESLDDQQEAVYRALVAYYEDPTDNGCFVDVWIEDWGLDWVVWCSYGNHPQPGLWRMQYSVGDDGAVMFTAPPEPVAKHTSYTPIVQRSLDAVALEAERLRLNGRRHRSAA